MAIIIPAHNEADRIGLTVQGAWSLNPAELVVVDDGSVDETGPRARAAGARVVRLARNRGKGLALAAGLDQTMALVVLFLDGDLGLTAGNAGPLLEPLLGGEADMSIGLLPREGRRPGLGLTLTTARWGCRILTGRSFVAPLSGQRALSRAVARALQPYPPGFGLEICLTVRAVRAGYRVVEIPVELVDRGSGCNLAGFLHRGQQWYAVSQALAAEAWRGWWP
ncbi:MAG: glycosyltransferase family 2 protein [Bacillota bacterium]